MRIPTSIFSGNEEYHTQFPWEDVIEGIQGGTRGIVFKRDGESYRTAFVEVWGKQVTFVRGEGKTIAEAEESAWNQCQRFIACSNHEYEPRNYKNGAGFCKNCGRFASKVFTAEQLGITCQVCGIFANWSWDANGGYCQTHVPPNPYLLFEDEEDE